MKNLELDELMERGVMPSPVFEVVPGWGGKTKKWLRENFHNKVFPSLAIIVVLIGIASYFSRPKSAVVETGSETKREAQIISLLIEQSEGIIATSRRALNQYLNSRPKISLKPEQKLYIDNYFKEKFKDVEWKPGTNIDFSGADMEQAVAEALALSESKLEKFRAYLK